MKKHHLVILWAAMWSPLAQAAPPAPTISFQARLLDPVTGMIKPNGSYSVSFLLYASATGGVAAWSETKSVTVSNGFFSTQLGDISPLAPGNFDQYHIWLGLQVAGDAEMVPRHRISWAPYALEAFQLQGLTPGQLLRRDTWDIMSVNNGTNDALVITQATDRSALRATSQADSAGESAIKGIAQAASATVINSAAGVLGSSQSQRGVIGISDINDGVFGWSTGGAGVNAQSINGYGITAFSQNNHAIYAGGTGTISALKLEYRTPRKHWASIPASSFHSRTHSSTVGYISPGSTGGSYFTAGSEWVMHAPVDLPHGAVVTNLTATMSDTSTTTDLTCRLYRIANNLYATMAEVETSGSGGVTSPNDTSIGLATIDNQNYSYSVGVFSSISGSGWSSVGFDLQIKRVNIEYQLSEAP